jgi:hypothetical protein
MRLLRIIVGGAMVTAAACATIGVGIALLPLARADTRITVPGASPDFQSPLYWDITGFTAQDYAQLNPEIGENWLPGTTPEVVDYPASIGVLSGSLDAPDANTSIAIGQAQLDSDIMSAVANSNGSPVDIAGLSMGTIVIDRELAYLATDPTAPPASDLQFVEFSNPELSLADIYLGVGTTVPVANYTVGDLPDTQYDVSVVFGQYDFWGDTPDRPWDLLAWVNSLFGALYYHGPTSLASLSDAVELSSVTDSLGGVITTYMVPSPILPMLLPLEQIGVPTQIVDDLNSVLQPIVNDGYSSLTPDAGPYFSEGSLVDLPTATELVSSVEADIAGLDLPGLFGPDGFAVLGTDLGNLATVFGSDLVDLLGLI